MDKGKGINNSDLKQRNRGLLLQLITTGECSTRISLARSSRLTKMSVTNIIDEFIQMKLVVEGEREKQEIQGRNPVLLEISPSAPKVIGILINREYCAAVLCDLLLNVLCTKRIEMDSGDREWFLDNLCGLIDSMLDWEPNVLGIGVASIGPLDVAKGVLLNPPRFYGIKNVPLVAELKERYGLPVFMDHQYNSAARAEKLFGCGKNFSSFIFVGITNGIGAGIYLDGRILQSQAGLGSELGHMSVDYRGVRCECGNYGCVENYASATVICRKAEAAVGRRLTFDECCELCDETIIDRIITDAVDKLGYCLVSVCNLLNPEAVILGHEGVKLPQRYLERMEDYINQHKLTSGYNHIRILKASFGEETQLAGAACNVLDQVFRGRILFDGPKTP